MVSDISNEYWFIVEECLVKFHDMDLITARKEIQGIKDRLGQNNLIYHVEPFELACDIGKKDLEINDYWNDYREIIKLARTIG